MPVLRCPACDGVIVHSGKALQFDCPQGHRPYTDSTLHVDEHLVSVSELNGDGFDARYTGFERLAKSRKHAEAAFARHGW